MSVVLCCIGLIDNHTKNYFYCTCSVINTIHVLPINLLSGLGPGDYRVFFTFEISCVKCCYVILTSIRIALTPNNNYLESLEPRQN